MTSRKMRSGFTTLIKPQMSYQRGKKAPFPFWPFLGILLCLLLMGYGMLDIIRNLIRDFLRP